MCCHVERQLLLIHRLTAWLQGHVKPKWLKQDEHHFWREEARGGGEGVLERGRSKNTIPIVPSKTRRHCDDASSLNLFSLFRLDWSD